MTNLYSGVAAIAIAAVVAAAQGRLNAQQEYQVEPLIDVINKATAETKTPTRSRRVRRPV